MAFRLGVSGGGGAAEAGGFPGQAVLLPLTDEVVVVESVECVLEHGVFPPEESVSVIAFRDVSTFVSEAGPPHREGSVSSGRRGALGGAQAA
ncbi:hypothetical protein GCM10010415_35110 [Streptomyces atrovirens]